MENKNLFIIMVLIIVCLLLLSFIIIIKDTANFRNSSEGKCLKEIAKDYCVENKMTFIKVYSPWYDDSFACYDERESKHKEIHFTNKELRRCS